MCEYINPEDESWRWHPQRQNQGRKHGQTLQPSEYPQDPGFFLLTEVKYFI